MVLIRPSLHLVLKCYLFLMQQFENEEMVVAFGNILTTFADYLGPFAVEICQQLAQQLTKFVEQESR